MKDKDLSYKSPQNTQIRALVPQDMSLVITPAQARLEESEIARDTELTHSEAYDRANRMIAGRDKIEAFKRATSLQVHANSIIPTDGMDLLEEFRKQTGLVEAREKLQNRLLEALSFEKGLAFFNKTSNRSFENMDDLNKAFPSMTKTEIILFALLKNIPKYYLNYGNSDTSQNPEANITPMIVGYGTNGIETTLEIINPNKTFDGYEQIGVTGTSQFVEFTDYAPEIRQLLEELVALTITNERLHERVWQNFDSSISVGIGNLDREAIRRVIGKDLNLPIGQIKRMLSQEQKELFKHESKNIDERFGKNLLLDAKTKQTVTGPDMVRLIGLIDKIPSSMIDDITPFDGYYMPYGLGILFIDKSGKREFVQYKSAYLREAYRGLYYESVDSSKTNKTYIDMLSFVVSQAEKKAFDSVSLTGENPSILEGLKLDFKLEFGIDLKVNPEITTSTTNIDKFSEGKIQRINNMKMSAEEAQFVYKILKLMPIETLAKVKSIGKEIKDDSNITALTSGFDVSAHNNQGDITLFHDNNLPFLLMSQEFKEAYAFTLVHELTHSFWKQLTRDEQDEWTQISWIEKRKADTSYNEENGFLTMYSYIDNEREDFSEHVASFVLHGQEFRDKSTSNEKLNRKYEFIKKVMSKVSGKDVEYPQISTYSIAEIFGDVNKLVQKMELEDAVSAIETRMLQEEIDTLKNKTKVETRLDRVDDKIGKRIEELAARESAMIAVEENDFKNWEIKVKEESFIRGSIEMLRGYLTDSLSDTKAAKMAIIIFEKLQTGLEFDEFLDYMQSRIDETNWEYFLEDINHLRERFEFK